jgi:hypothetical protein
MTLAMLFWVFNKKTHKKHGLVGVFDQIEPHFA